MAKFLQDVGAAIPYFNAAVTTTNETVQIGESLLFGYNIHNTTAADGFIQLFDALIADVTVGTTVPTYVIPVGANGVPSEDFVIPILFKIGIVIASTTAVTGATGAIQDVSLRIA